MIEALKAFIRPAPEMPRIQDPTRIKSDYRYWRTRIMYSMMSGYAVYYFVRKNFSIANKSISEEFHFSNTEMGLILSAATVAYGISKFASGILVDILNPRFLMSAGLILSALTNIFFGMGAGLTVFIVLWALNNLFQGLGMPPCGKLLNSWFSRKEGGRAWGLWNASHQIGGGLIFLIAGFLVSEYGWRSSFYVPGVFAILVGLFLINRLRDTPAALGLPPVHEYAGESDPFKEAQAQSGREIFINYILKNRILWIVCIANIFVYIVRIGVFDWAPKFLVSERGFTTKEASVAGFAFEVSGIFGAIAAGWLSDTAFPGRRGAIATVFMVWLAAAIGIVFASPAGNFWLMIFAMVSVGFFVYGPQVLVAVVAAENVDARAVGTAVGMTGFFGYVGATICGVGTGYVVDHFGWDVALVVYLISALIGAGLFAIAWKPVMRR